MFLPHFFVSSCPVDTFLIDYTGTRCGNQYQYICVYIIDIRWAGTIGNSILCQFVSPCLTMSHDYTCCLGLSHISRIFNVPSSSKIPSRPSPRFSTRPAGSRQPVRLPVSSACLLTCPLSFLIVLPNLVCGLCELFQVVYIDWNIGYHVNCQEGNDGQCSPVRRLRR